MHTIEEKKAAFERLLTVLDTLREKCPWDRKQTNQSLRPNTIEEVYELCEALISEDNAEIRKECGDVLLHVCFYAKIGEEKGAFDIADVCNSLCDKLIYRHPHVYGEAVANDAGQVCENWEKLKLKEKGSSHTTLGGVPHALPSLIKAYRIQDKAANVGFDWGVPGDKGKDEHDRQVKREQVWDKVKEEIGEFQAEVENMDKEKASAEFGDLLFALVNAARLYHINPDTALEQTNQKFTRRFNYVEQQAKARGRDLPDMTLGEMDRLWNEAKALGL